jgi:hypothetical protein
VNGDQSRDPAILDVAPIRAEGSDRSPYARTRLRILSTYSDGFVNSSDRKEYRMKIGFAIALFPLILTAASVSAQSPCLECFKAAEQELKKCLDNAISQEDKNSCAEERDERAEACDQGECKIERENKKSGTQKEGSQ